MSSNKYLIDSNSFITPHNQYYPFDFAPGFWTQMEENIENGNIIVLDMVKNEILQGNDDLREWMEKLQIGNYVDHRDTTILQLYAQVLQYIQSSLLYKPEALQEWARGSVADPWLIATAKARDLMLVSFESRNHSLNSHCAAKRAKIPDVADALGVRTTDLFHMMRDLNFTLK